MENGRSGKYQTMWKTATQAAVYARSKAAEMVALADTLATTKDQYEAYIAANRLSVILRGKGMEETANLAGKAAHEYLLEVRKPRIPVGAASQE